MQIFDYTQTPDFIYIIMEFASQGNLRSFIRKYPKLFKDPKICLKFIFKLLLGVQAIHDAGYVHGNLKDLNIVIDKELNPKIIDLDRVVKINERYHVFYNRRYLPPEMVRRKHIDFRWSLDVYVIGTSLFEMVQNGDFPFPKNGEIDRVEAIIKGTNVMNHRTNVSVLYLIFRLMHPDPRCRFTPKEAMIYIHEMIQNIPKQNFKIPNLFSSHKIPNEIVSFVFPKYRQINDTRGGREDEGRRAMLRVREVLFLCPNVRGSRFRFLILSRSLWSLSVRHKSLPFEKTTLTHDIMSDQNETTTTTPSEPKLCNAGCGFFVSSSKGWCCLISAGS